MISGKAFWTVSATVLLLTGCGGGSDTDSSSASGSSAVSSSQASSASSQPEMSSSSEPAENWTIDDFYPFEANVSYTYAGEGNEFAGFTAFPQYLEDNKLQLVTNNGGTQIVTVYEKADGELRETFERAETYFRENMLDKEPAEDDQAQLEILLKEPLETGNSWTNPGGSTATIIAVNEAVETPAGNYETIAVETVQDENQSVVNYYAEGIGLVKREIKEGDTILSTATLSERKTGASETQTLQVFHPDDQAMGIDITEADLTFQTNDVTREKLAALLKDIPETETFLIGSNVKINSLFLHDDGMVYVDFSRELITEMNAGSSVESLILQSIVNTLGTYYGVEEVLLTVEGKPYESGHIVKAEGEPFTVSQEDVNEGQ